MGWDGTLSPVETSAARSNKGKLSPKSWEATCYLGTSQSWTRSSLTLVPGLWTQRQKAWLSAFHRRTSKIPESSHSSPASGPSACCPTSKSFIVPPGGAHNHGGCGTVDERQLVADSRGLKASTFGVHHSLEIPQCTLCLGSGGIWSFFINLIF